MTNDIRTFLTSTNPFNQLPHQELDSLIAHLHVVTHMKGDTIFYEGEKAENMWILYSGRVETFKYSIDGKPLAIECILPKSFFGTFCRLGMHLQIYPCTAMSANESISIKMPDLIFWDLFNRFPHFSAQICFLCSQRLFQLQEWISGSHDRVYKRIIKTLVSLAKNNGPMLNITKREIAEMSATTVETTIRTLSVFEKKHWISSKRGKIHLKNMPHLESIITTPH